MRIRTPTSAAKVSQNELCEVLKELIYYPQNLSYKNIDLIPVGSEVIIKLTHHLDIQLISRNKVILDELLQFAEGVEGLTYMELRNEQTF